MRHKDQQDKSNRRTYTQIPPQKNGSCAKKAPLRSRTDSDRKPALRPLLDLALTLPAIVDEPPLLSILGSYASGVFDDCLSKSIDGVKRCDLL